MKSIFTIATIMLSSMNAIAQQHNWVQITGGKEQQTYPLNNFQVEGGLYFGENFYLRGAYMDSRETNGGSDNNGLYYKHTTVEAGYTLHVAEGLYLELGGVNHRIAYKNIEMGGTRQSGTYIDSSFTGTGFGTRLNFEHSTGLLLTVGYLRLKFPTITYNVTQLEIRKPITKSLYGVAGYSKPNESVESWKVGVGYRFE